MAYNSMSDPDTPTGLGGWTMARLRAGDPNRSTGLYRFVGPSDLERNISKEIARRNNTQNTSNLPSPTAISGAAGAAPAPSGPQWGDISGLFREAISGLSGDTEKMYQQGKRRTLSDIAMQSVNAGMANTLNMPVAGVAYDEANRAPTNLALGTQKANILTGLGQTAAGMYGQNLGAQTQRYGIDVGAQTSRYGIDVGAQTSRYGTDVGAQTSQYGTVVGAQSDAAQRALQKYIAELSSRTAVQTAALRG